MQGNAIHFFEVDGPYGEFANFYPSEFELNDKRWQSSEHYFQAMKYENTDYEEQIRLAEDPYLAKKLGSTREIRLREDWEEIKYQKMLEGILAKFTQNENLKQLLLATNDLYIAEHCGDIIWGDGLDGSGQNLLGKVLMEVRERIRNEDL